MKVDVKNTKEVSIAFLAPVWLVLLARLCLVAPLMIPIGSVYAAAGCADCGAAHPDSVSLNEGSSGSVCLTCNAFVQVARVDIERQKYGFGMFAVPGSPPTNALVKFYRTARTEFDYDFTTWHEYVDEGYYAEDDDYYYELYAAKGTAETKLHHKVSITYTNATGYAVNQYGGYGMSASWENFSVGREKKSDGTQDIWSDLVVFQDDLSEGGPDGLVWLLGNQPGWSGVQYTGVPMTVIGRFGIPQVESETRMFVDTDYSMHWDGQNPGATSSEDRETYFGLHWWPDYDNQGLIYDAVGEIVIGGEEIVTLTQEYTTSELKQDALHEVLELTRAATNFSRVSAPTKVAASWNLDVTETNVSVSAVRVRVGIENPDPRLKYEVVSFSSYAGLATNDHGYLETDPVTGKDFYFVDLAEDGVFRPRSDNSLAELVVQSISARPDESQHGGEPAAGSTGYDGGGSFGVGSAGLDDGFNLNISLGTGSGGLGSGGLRAAGDSFSNDLLNPASLRLLGSGHQLLAVTDANGALSQVKSAGGLVNITSLANGYQAHIYRPANVSTNGTNYSVSGAAEAVWTVSGWNPGDPDLEGVRVVEQRGTQSVTNDYTYDPAGKWTLSASDGASLSEITLSQDVHTTRTLDPVSGAAVSRHSVSNLVNDFGSVVAAEYVGLNNEFATHYGYTLIQSAITGVAFQRLTSVLSSDGRWRLLEYDDQGRQTDEYSNYLDQGPTSDPSLCRHTEYIYDNQGEFQFSPREVREYAKGQLLRTVTRGYEQFESTSLVPADRMELVHKVVIGNVKVRDYEHQFPVETGKRYRIRYLGGAISLDWVNSMMPYTGATMPHLIDQARIWQAGHYLLLYADTDNAYVMPEPGDDIAVGNPDDIASHFQGLTFGTDFTATGPFASLKLLNPTDAQKQDYDPAKHFLAKIFPDAAETKLETVQLWGVMPGIRYRIEYDSGSVVTRTMNIAGGGISLWHRLGHWLVSGARPSDHPASDGDAYFGDGQQTGFAGHPDPAWITTAYTTPTNYWEEYFGVGPTLSLNLFDEPYAYQDNLSHGLALNIYEVTDYYYDNRVGKPATTFGIYRLYDEDDGLTGIKETETVSAPGQQSLTTVTWRQKDEYNVAGSRVYRIDHPDGTLTLNQFSGDIDGAHTFTRLHGKANADRSDVEDGTREITAYGNYGELYDRSVFDILTGKLIDREMYANHDAAGRPQSVSHLDGTVTLRQYGCCGLESETRDGLTTIYGYDGLKRLKTITRGTETTINYYDVHGNLVQRIRQGDPKPIVDRAYDELGRLLWDKSHVRRNGQWDEDVTLYTTVTNGLGHRIDAATYPDLTTRVSEYHVDGSLLRVTGTAVHGRRHEYEVVPGLEKAREYKLTSGGADTSEWVEHWTDGMGRPNEVHYPDGISYRTAYGSHGKLMLDTRPAGGQYDYDGRGRLKSFTRTLGGGDPSTLEDYILEYERFADTSEAWPGRDALVTETYSWLADTRHRLSRTERLVDARATARITAAGITRTEVVCNPTCVTTVTRPDGTYSVTETDSEGRPSKTAYHDANGLELTHSDFAYPDRDTSLVLDGRGAGVLARRDFQGRPLSTEHVQPNGATNTHALYSYDIAGRVTNSVVAGTTVNREYFATGELKKSVGSGPPVEYSYDYDGRLKTMTTWQDHAAGSGSAVTTWGYEPLRGMLTSKQYADGSSVSYGHDLHGRMDQRTSAGGQVDNYGYSDLHPGRVVDLDDDGAPEFTHDQLGRLTGFGTDHRILHPSGRILTEIQSGYAVSYGYDHLLRRTNMTVMYGGETVHSVDYAYDAAGRLATVGSGLQSATYVYRADVPSQMEELRYSFDGAPTVTVSREFSTGDTEGLNLVSAVSAYPAGRPGAPLGSVAYGHHSESHRRIRATNETGRVWSYDYGALGQLSQAVRQRPDGSLVPGQQFTYDHDDIGNRRTVRRGDNVADTNTLHAAVYTPNAVNQYAHRQNHGFAFVAGTAATNATVRVNNQPAARYGAEFFREINLGTNHAYQAGIATVAVITNVGPNGEEAVMTNWGGLFVPPLAQTFAHDADGRLTNDTHWTYTWNTRGRLARLETAPTAVLAGVPAHRLDFTYDALGRRSSRLHSEVVAGLWQARHQTDYVYDGWNLVYEHIHFDIGGAAPVVAITNTYTWGLDLSGSMQGAGGVGGNLFFTHRDGANQTVTANYVHDANGNVTALVAAGSTNVLARYDYSPFGETLAMSGPLAQINALRFSSKHQDEISDLYYYGHRYYNPDSGRWLSRDPIQERGGLNLYGFVQNDGVNRIDLLGLALYAFDGTWNDRKKMKSPTNVAKLVDVYQTELGGEVYYYPGVGTRWWNKHVGGLTGAGGKARVRDALKKLKKEMKKGDCVADIIGFSRGAAQAREFANMIKRENLPVKVRFLGVFDTVASFGYPGNDINNGYDLSIGDHVEHVAHATANGERRHFFPLHSIKSASDEMMLNTREEKGFPGAHSDVGGGYEDGDLSDGPLYWMWQKGVAAGAPFGPLHKWQTIITSPNPHEESGPKDDERRIYYP